MRFVIYGAGAVGGLIGGRLYLAGHEVALIARGPHLAAMQRQGLRIDSASGTETAACEAVSDASRLSWSGDETVVLATKSQDSPGALTDLLAHAPREVAIVCAQNGVNNERMFLRHIAQVYGVCVMCPVSHLAPGVVTAHSAPISGLLDIGRFPAGEDETAARVASALSAAGFESISRPDIMRWKYGKLLLNLANAVEALYRPSEAAGELVRLAREEGVGVLAAAGIAVVSKSEDARRRADKLNVQDATGQRRAGGSTWQSLTRRTGSAEADYLNGEIVLLGRLHHVETPVNAFLQRATGVAARRRMPPATLDADRALQAISR